MTVPTLAELRGRIAADIQAALPASLVPIVGSVGYVVAAVLAAAVWGVYRFGAWVFRQVFADTATAENLERLASLYGVIRGLPVAASGTLTVTGSASTVIAQGSIWARVDGAEYVSTAEATIGGGGSVSVPVEALAPGAAGNFASGSLVLTTPISGVDASADVNDPIAGGADAETDESLRGRLIDRLRTPPQGGAESDYIAWVRESLPNVSRVWVYPSGYGPGTVGVLFTVIDSDPIPASGAVALAQAYVDARAPVTAAVTVEGPTPLAVDLELEVGVAAGFVEAEVQAAVEAEIAGDFRQVEPSTVLYLSTIIGAAMRVPGVLWVEVTDPTANVTLAANEVPVVGSVTWL